MSYRDKPQFVYVHRDTNNIPFYVGKGKESRAFWQDGRSLDWYEIARNGYKVEVVVGDVSFLTSPWVEIELIKKCQVKRKGGLLVNVKDTSSATYEGAQDILNSWARQSEGKPWHKRDLLLADANNHAKAIVDAWKPF
jgi:hypothetical protein